MVNFKEIHFQNVTFQYLFHGRPKTNFPRKLDSLPLKAFYTSSLQRADQALDNLIRESQFHKSQIREMQKLLILKGAVFSAFCTEQKILTHSPQKLSFISAEAKTRFSGKECYQTI